MEGRLSEKWAKVHVTIIGIFYLISGSWEYLLGLTQAENIGQGIYFLLDIYRNYLIVLGVITILAGIVILFKLNIARLFVVILTWWNLFTAPLIQIWWYIYTMLIKKYLITDSIFMLCIATVILISIMTFIRIYVIYILRTSKAGYIFLKETK